MTEPLIPGGYILLSRKLIESEIWSKPPLYLKIWVYLLSKAQHKDYKGLKRGQLWTSIPEIQEAMSYRAGFRIEKPSKKQVWSVLEWLRKTQMENSSEILVNDIVNETMVEPMIETTKATHGILVSIVKYSDYQDPKNYESNADGNDEGMMKELRRERQGNNINKNVQECTRMYKKKDIRILTRDEEQFLTTLSQIENYPLDRKRDLELYQTLTKRYPALDLNEAIEQWRTYKLDKPLTEKSNPRSQINTAFKKYTEWGKCLKGGERSGQDKQNSGKNTKRPWFDKSKFLYNG